MPKKKQVYFTDEFNEYLKKEKELYLKETDESERIDWEKVWDGKKDGYKKESDSSKVNWKKVNPAGSSRPKFNFREFFKGLMLAYLYLCLVVLGLIIVDIIDHTNTYTGHLEFFISFLVPSIFYIIYKAVRKFF